MSVKWRPRRHLVRKGWGETCHKADYSIYVTRPPDSNITINQIHRAINIRPSFPRTVTIFLIPCVDHSRHLYWFVSNSYFFLEVHIARFNSDMLHDRFFGKIRKLLKLSKLCTGGETLPCGCTICIWKRCISWAVDGGFPKIITPPVNRRYP